jgi:NAD(P)-dependent dehydrogenase (short-subunit alcohol dehydrogenase family)
VTAIRLCPLASAAEVLRFALPHQSVTDGARLAPEKSVDAKPKTIIVTGAAQGIGAGVTKGLLKRGYNVVANSLHFAQDELASSKNLALVEGDVAAPATAAQIGATALSRFGSIDGVVNNAGIYLTKAFTEFTPHGFERLSAINLLGYIYVTQLAVKQMLEQRTGGSVIAVSSAMVEHPIAGVKASIPMVTKGGLEALTRSLAMEYAKDGIRFNSVAPGVVNTPMHGRDSDQHLKSLSPMGEMTEISDVVDAILYLTEARRVTGEVLHVDAGMHNGKW